MEQPDREPGTGGNAAAGISRREALELMSSREADLETLIDRAATARRSRFGPGVGLCAIINAKSGLCPERCAFCSQSRHFHTSAPVHPLRTPEEVLGAARRAERDGAGRFSIVTSGRFVGDAKEIENISRALRLIDDGTGLGRCASLGLLHPGTLEALAGSGLQRYHHNVETAPSFHDRIVPTRSFDDEVGVIERARDAGLQTCCGGIFGMGETDAQRVELIFALRDIDPDCIPINFLVPIKGTPLEDASRLTPQDCLRITAVARLAMPGKPIVICGGREKNLGALQWRMFDAGATGAMVGDYLTTRGQSPEEDRAMIDRAGYILAGGGP